MKLVMMFNTIDPSNTACYWSEYQQNWVTIKVPIVIHIEAESIESLRQEFEKELTNAAKYFASQGDGITFGFHGYRIWLPDFYPGKKHSKYTEERNPSPAFLTIEDWVKLHG